MSRTQPTARPPRFAASVMNTTSHIIHGTWRTLRDISHFGATNNRIVGTPEQIADKLAKRQSAGADGNYEIPGPYKEFVDHAISTLQARGLAQKEYAEGTLRQKLFGRGDQLPDRHQAARCRGAFGKAAGSEAKQGVFA